MHSGVTRKLCNRRGGTQKSPASMQFFAVSPRQPAAPVRDAQQTGTVQIAGSSASILLFPRAGLRFSPLYLRPTIASSTVPR